MNIERLNEGVSSFTHLQPYERHSSIQPVESTEISPPQSGLKGLPDEQHLIKRGAADADAQHGDIDATIDAL